MSKLERLLNLTVALLETERPLTAEQLRERVPGYPEEKTSFRRAFERDKETLRAMGVPLRLTLVPGHDPPIDGYLVRREDYELPDPGLDADELAALHLAAQAVRVGGGAGTEALWKLGGAPADADANAPTTEVSVVPSDANLVALFSGVTDRRTATFSYRGAERSVDPYRLDFQRGRWYLGGYDHLREEERNYRVDRIEGEVAPGEPGAFARPATAVPGLRLAPWQLGDGEAVTARLAVDADQAPSAVAQLGEEAVVARHPDGSVELELAVTNPDGFRSFVLTFLEHAEVLDPPELRADVVRWLEALAAP